ncbi:hypothetical protein K5I04_03580 [Murdochiella sp. Marseille-P8839]|nr:hypothetical protein [Murdochiella sp. Marseille-P8839]
MTNSTGTMHFILWEYVITAGTKEIDLAQEGQKNWYNRDEKKRPFCQVEERPKEK